MLKRNLWERVLVRKVKRQKIFKEKEAV